MFSSEMLEEAHHKAQAALKNQWVETLCPCPKLLLYSLVATGQSHLFYTYWTKETAVCMSLQGPHMMCTGASLPLKLKPYLMHFKREPVKTLQQRRLREVGQHGAPGCRRWRGATVPGPTFGDTTLLPPLLKTSVHNMNASGPKELDLTKVRGRQVKWTLKQMSQLSEEACPHPRCCSYI